MLKHIVSAFAASFLAMVIVAASSCGGGPPSGWWCHGYATNPLDPTELLTLVFPVCCEGDAHNKNPKYPTPDQRACMDRARKLMEVWGYGTEMGETAYVTYCAYFRPSETPPKAQTPKVRTKADCLAINVVENDDGSISVPDGCKRVTPLTLYNADAYACDDSAPPDPLDGGSSVCVPASTPTPGCAQCLADSCACAFNSCNEDDTCLCLQLCDFLEAASCADTTPACAGSSLAANAAGGCAAVACSAECPALVDYHDGTL